MTFYEAYPSAVPLLAVLVSLVAAGLIVASGRRPALRETWTLAAAALKFALVLGLVPGALAGRAAEATLFDVSPGIALALRADPLGVFFALVASGLWVVTSVYSIGYVRAGGEANQTRYFASFAVCLSATIGVAFSANLLTFLIFYEILSLATYPLVIHKETPEALAAGRKYLAYALTAGGLLLVATAWTWQAAGTLEFRPGGILAGSGAGPGTIRAIFLLALAGVGVKAGIMPLHGWLPSAMVAPTPVSALLHAVAVVKSGVFGVVRLVGFVFGPELMGSLGLATVLAVFAGATVVLASLLALRQDNLKRRLAYSTVGHLSYIILGVALLSPSGLGGALLHLANHATMKITLFFCAGAIYVSLHKKNISELDGVGRDMPWTMGAFAVGALGLAGVPPVNGFVSKYLLCVGTLEAGEIAALVVLLLSGLLNAAYFFPIVHRAFFRPSRDSARGREAPASMVIPIVVVAVLSVGLGLFPNLFFDLATAVTAGVLAGPGGGVTAGIGP